MKKVYIIGFCILIVALVLWFRFEIIPSSSPTKEHNLSITASQYPLVYLATEIAGPGVEVSNVIPLGAEPHEFEPSPADVAKIYDADIFIFNGVEIDPWAVRLQQDLAEKSVVPIKASASVEVIDGDPHFWLDPEVLVTVAERLMRVLVQLDPVSGGTYAENFESFKAKMLSLDSDYKSALGTCSKPEVFISHNFLAYQSKKYGFKVYPLLGLSPDSEASPSEVAKLISEIKLKQAGYVFTETLVPSKVAEVVAKETGVKIEILNPIEGLTEEETVNGYDYESLMRKNLDALRLAMLCS